MTATTGTRRGSGRSVLVGVLLVGVLLVIGALAADQETGRPFDPASAKPNGTKALHQLLSDVGAKVSVPDHLPRGDDADVAIVFSDLSDERGRESLQRWVEAGHVLVVADPSSELVPMATFDPGGLTSGSSTISRDQCDIDALRNLGELDPGTSSVYGYVDEGNFPVCFARDGSAFVVTQTHGDGIIVGLGSPDVFVNERLGLADNAALATDLLAPRPGTRVALLDDRAFLGGEGEGEGPSLGELIGPGVKLAFLELAVALVVLALAAGRRLGRPIDEPQPVQIAGSELVDAMGQLLQQTRDPAAAAAVLRDDLRRLITERMGVPFDADLETVADTLASRTRLERDVVRYVLAVQPITTDAELTALVAQLDAIRQEVLHGHAT